MNLSGGTRLLGWLNFYLADDNHLSCNQFNVNLAIAATLALVICSAPYYYWGLNLILYLYCSQVHIVMRSNGWLLRQHIEVNCVSLAKEEPPWIFNRQTRSCLKFLNTQLYETNILLKFLCWKLKSEWFAIILLLPSNVKYFAVILEEHHQKSLSNTKIAFSLLPGAAQTALTKWFVSHNVAYWPTVYETGVVAIHGSNCLLLSLF